MQIPDIQIQVVQVAPNSDERAPVSTSKPTRSQQDISTNIMLNPEVLPQAERAKISEFEMSPSNATMKASPNIKKKKMVDMDDIAPILQKLRKNVGEEPVNIRKDEEESKLSYEKMMTAVNENHARNAKGKQYSCSEACCGIETGYHFCCGTSKNTEFEKFGVGINLYFKFLKYLMGFFILFVLLSIPSLYLSSEAAKSIRNFSITTYSNLLFASTIGTFGYDSFVCYQTTYGSNQTVVLDCGTDLLRYNNSMYGLVAPDDYMADGCFYTDVYQVDSNCDDLTAYETFFMKNCENQTNCTFQVDSTLFTNSTECAEKMQSYYLYFNSYCQSETLKLSNGFEIQKKYIPVIISFFDAGIILAYIFMLISLGISQKKAVNNVLHNSLSPALFTLEITNLPTNLDQETLIVVLWNHIEMVLNEAYRPWRKIFRIIDIKLAQRNKMINYSYQKGELIRKRNQKIRKWAKEYDPHRALPEAVLLSDLKNFLGAIDPKVEEKAKYDYYQMEKMDLKVAKLEQAIQACEKEKIHEFKTAWVTFETMKQRDLAYHYFFSTALESCCIAMCSEDCSQKKKKLFFGKELKMSTAPDPSNINWLNLNSSKMSKFIRRLLSILVTACLLIGTFALIVYIKIQQQDFLAQYPDIDCSLHTNLTKTDVETDYSSKTRQGLAECYCQQDLSARINEVFTVQIGGDTSEVRLCQIWLQKDLFVNLLPFLIVIVIVAINMIMQTIFKILSAFEKHKYVSAELASRVIKIFIAQFLNTGIILLIMNIRFTSQGTAAQTLQSVIKGRYYDFSPLWFEGVGTVVLLTMFINVFSTPLMVVFFHLLRLLKRCLDQRCKCDRHISKQKNQKKYEEIYMGPEFLIDFRYAQVLTSIFVCFFYSAGLPFLYVTTCFQLFLIYWLDKIFILKVCKLPKNIDEKIEIYVRDLLFFIVVVHLLFAIWIYGDDTIFPETVEVSSIEQYQNYADNFLSSSNFNGGYLDVFKNRVVKTQNIILLIILLGIVVYLIIAFLLWRPFKKFCALCCKKCSFKGFISIKNKLAKMNFYKVMTKEQISKEKILTQVTLSEIGSNINPEYKKRMDEKLKMMDEQSKIRTSAELVNFKFIGVPTYDMRQNPTFKEMFAIDEFIILPA